MKQRASKWNCEIDKRGKMRGMKFRNSSDNVQFNEYRFSRIVRFFKQKRRTFCWRSMRQDEREIVTR